MATLLPEYSDNFHPREPQSSDGRCRPCYSRCGRNAVDDSRVRSQKLSTGSTRMARLTRVAKRHLVRAQESERVSPPQESLTRALQRVSRLILARRRLLRFLCCPPLQCPHQSLRKCKKTAAKLCRMSPKVQLAHQMLEQVKPQTVLTPWWALMNCPHLRCRLTGRMQS